MNRSILLLLGLWIWANSTISGQYFSDLEKLNTEINTSRYDEIRPIVSPDGQQLFFTREAYPLFNHNLIEKGENLALSLSEEDYRQHLSAIYSSMAGRQIEDPIRSSFNQDIWIASTDKATFDRVSHPHTPLNNAFPNSICAFNTIENAAIVINQFPKEGGVLPGFSIIPRKSKEQWGDAESLFIENFNPKSPDVNLALSEDGEVMLLSQQGKNAYNRSNDIYISFRISPHQWSEPRHLGPAINTAYHETAPFLSPDKKTLFFTSNRRGGAGGNDIYFVQRLDDTWRRWTAPRRFLAPVNSAGEDSHPFFHKKSGYLYFTSKREGSSDIYRVKIAMPALEEVSVAGRVMTSDCGERVKAVIFSGPSDESFFREVYESKDGYYRIKVPKGEAYDILAQRPGYVGQIENVHFNSAHVYFKDHQLDLLMEPMESGKSLSLKKIFFQQSQATILEHSLPVLDLLAEMLRENPGLHIAVEGHTDNWGDQQSLQQLSEERARAIADFLTQQKGIDAQRIKSIGYGDAFPLNDNSTEDLRQKNRRVEILIDHFKNNPQHLSRLK